MLKDLYVMRVDAKQELDNINDIDDLKKFKKSILVPKDIDINLLLDGEKYFLVGEKGSGKTALLIYTALQAEELFEAERSFIIFKEFSQEEREDYTSMSHVTQYEQTEIKPFYDYEYVWRWILHNNIADTIQHSQKEIFIYNEELTTYLAAVNSISKNPRGDKRYLPLITKDGYVEASISVPVFSTNVNLAGKVNFERNPLQKDQVKLSTHINELDRLLCNLIAGDSQLYVVVDEMNLSTKNAEEYDRDILMIRDSIVVIDKFNALCKNSHDNIRIIASIRSEVVNSVKSRGKEINKIIESYSIPIDWTIYEKDKITHPLIKVLIQYLRLSDKSQSDPLLYSDEDIYSMWIDSSFYSNVSSVATILDFTLYRPRHVVRFLRLTKQLCGDSKKISKATFEKIKRHYARECWDEVTEDLSLKYNAFELSEIQEWLTGVPYFTDYNELYEKANQQWRTRESCNGLLTHFEELIRDIYRAGIIGTFCKDYNGQYKTTIHRWCFRGDDILMKSQTIQIHRIFQPILSSPRPKREF